MSLLALYFTTLCSLKKRFRLYDGHRLNPSQKRQSPDVRANLFVGTTTPEWDQFQMSREQSTHVQMLHLDTFEYSYVYAVSYYIFKKTLVQEERLKSKRSTMRMGQDITCCT